MAHDNKKQQDLELQQKHERNLELIRRLRLIDDDFMEKVFEDKACAELLLRIILERDDLTVCKCQYKNDQKVENKNVHFPRSIPQLVFP